MKRSGKEKTEAADPGVKSSRRDQSGKTGSGKKEAGKSQAEKTDPDKKKAGKKSQAAKADSDKKKAGRSQSEKADPDKKKTGKSQAGKGGSGKKKASKNKVGYDRADSLGTLRKQMEKVQDAKRFEHTLGVEFTSAALAMRYGVSVQSARTAGLLHDCAKCLTDKKRVAICRKNNIPMTDLEKANPFLLHAKVGAFLAEEKYGVTDRDVLNAIRNHTTGRPGMSLLEKIVFIADYMEPGRNHAPDLEEVRRLAFQDLDQALVRILDDTLAYLDSKKGDVDPVTRETWEYYKDQDVL